MPTYEYVCRSCDAHIEVVQSFRDDPLTECATCSGQLRKKFSAAGIVFKGSGYYVTDTRSSSDSSGSGGSSDGSSNGSSDSSSKDSSSSGSSSKDSSSSGSSSSTKETSSSTSSSGD